MAKRTRSREWRKARSRVGPGAGWVLAVLLPGVESALALFDWLAAGAIRYNPTAQAAAAVGGGLLIATAVVLLCRGPLSAPLTRLMRAMARRLGPRLSAATVALAIVLAGVGSVLLLPPSTKHVLRSWLRGAQVNLAAAPGAAGVSRADRALSNLPWFCFGCDFGSKRWNQSVATRRAEIEAELLDARARGIQRVAWFLLADGRGLEFDDYGAPLPPDAAFWADYDAALEIARKLDIGILWVLIDQQWFYPGRKEVGPDGVEVELAGHAAVINTKEKRDRFISDILTPLVSRYPHERQILGWVLLNEPDNVVRAGYLAPDAFAAFVRDASAAIRRQTAGQPVSVGFNDVVSLVDAGEQAPDVLSELDFLIFHHYDERFPPPADHVRSLLPASSRRKPIYVGEFEPSREFAVWLHTVGYDASWPWSLNTLKQPTRPGAQPGPDPVQPRVGLEAIVTTMRSLAMNEAIPAFAKRRVDGSSRTRAGREQWATWLDDGRILVRTLADRDRTTKEREASLETDDAGEAALIEQKNREQAGPVRECFVDKEATLRRHEQDFDRETRFADQHIRDLENLRKTIEAQPPGAPDLPALRAEAGRQEKYVAEFQGKAAAAAGEVERAKAAREECVTWESAVRRTIESAEDRRRDIREELAGGRRLELLRQKVYLDFWDAELDWAIRAGLLATR